jgi:hypothetical protein
MTTEPTSPESTDSESTDPESTGPEEGVDADVTLQPNDTPEERQERSMLRLETRLAKAEAQIRTMQDGIADLNRATHILKQRALVLRIGILIALLGAFFYMRSL